MIKLGVMQGRLGPKFEGRYQAFHPFEWEKEFYVAKEIGLNCIEFIFDSFSTDLNPLVQPQGIEKIRLVSKSTGVKVLSICADFFMEHPMHGLEQSQIEAHVDIFRSVIASAHAIEAHNIVVPCVDISSLKKSPQFIDQFAKSIQRILPFADEHGVKISLETDLGPKDFYALLNKIGLGRVWVNYDIGNSAALGYSVAEEFDAYGKWIFDVHIKDRVLGGSSVELGKGNADIENVLRRLADLKYDGPLIMQAYRDDEGVTIFRKQLSYVKEKLKSSGLEQ